MVLRKCFPGGRARKNQKKPRLKVSLFRTPTHLTTIPPEESPVAVVVHLLRDVVQTVCETPVMVGLDLLTSIRPVCVFLSQAGGGLVVYIHT